MFSLFSVVESLMEAKKFLFKRRSGSWLWLACGSWGKKRGEKGEGEV